MSQLNTDPIIDLVPNQAAIGLTQPPSRPSTTLEHQMMVNTDPTKPRGEPQLIGLTKYSYNPSQVPIQTTTTAPSQNYNQHKPKNQSEFSQQYQLVSVSTQNDEILLKSAYSECVTQSNRLEYNVVGVTQKLILVFAKVSSNVEVDQVQIQMQQAADIDYEERVLSGTIVLAEPADEKDDLKYLDALPHGSNPIFTRLLKQIDILGFNMLQIPPITNVTYFMNQSLHLSNYGKQRQSLEVDFMACQLLITTKRATQASEMIRKLQIAELNGQNSKYQKFVKCAVLELLITDSISGSLQINDKLHSIQRLFTFLQADIPSDINQRFYYQGQVTQTDVFTKLLEVLPECLRFTLACLSHKLEIVRISALKFLKFILEEIGCSLDFGLVFILKAMFKTYPTNVPQTDDFDFQKLLNIDMTIIEYLYKQKQIRARDHLVASKLFAVEEPKSGSQRAMVNIYNNVLDTVISVLSSASSQILHSIFYDVVESTILASCNYQVEVRIFNCKIADKILTICQGDLVLSPQLLDAIMNVTKIDKQLLPDSVENSAQSQLKSLWQSIRQKVLPNYSTKGFKQLVGWLVDRLSDMSQNDECVRQMAEIISILSLGRQKSEEDANQLIKLPSFKQYGGGPSSELYLVLSPLMHWLEYSIDREERFNLFTSVYQSIKDVLSGLPKGQTDLSVVAIMEPALIRASKFIEHNSPGLEMIKFLDIVLTDFQVHFKTKTQSEQTSSLICELLTHFVVYLPYSMFEESLAVFEKLLFLCQNSVTEYVLKSCILALIDKYSQRSKQFKSSLQVFMQFILSPPKDTQAVTHFEVMADFCFFQNNFKLTNKHKQLEFRSAQDIYDINIEMLQFFVDCITQMSDQHITVFTNLITHPSFKQNLLFLLQFGQSQIRLKSLEILESLTAYFVQFCPSKTIYEFTNDNQNDTMEAEFISHERLYISQIVVEIVRASLQRDTDSYLQFNALIQLDFLFQNLLPVPTFQNELIKAQKKDQDDENSGFNLDFEVLSISESTPEMDVMDPCYLRMRMKLVFSMWPYVQEALNSPWSNIRSICYGLICSMLRIDVNDFPHQEEEQSFDDVPTQATLQQIVLPMLMSLLSSRESESKAGGLNILGSFCGLSYDFSTIRVKKHLAFFQRNSKFVTHQIWKLVWKLQDDWDITIKEASVVLIQLCAPRNCVLYLESIKKDKEQSKHKFLKAMQPISEVYIKQAKPASMFPTAEDCKEVLNQSSDEETTHVTFEQFMFSLESSFLPQAVHATEIIAKSQELELQVHKFNPSYEDKRFLPGAQVPSSRRRQMEIELGIPQTQVIDETFFVDLYSDDQIQEITSIFRNDFKPPKSLWIEKQPQHQKQSGQQPAVSQSPDFYQYIYSDAIEQFNQHQLMMQQKQQDELQQQVSGGLSNSSLSSQESVIETQTNNETPSPPPQAQIEETKNDSPTSPAQISQAALGPTSPVLVCQKKTKLHIEKINLEGLGVNEPLKQESQQRQVANENTQETIKANNQGSPKNKPPVDPNRISRKTAQTYLSNLNNGYLQNFDNLRLLNTCLSQTMSPQYQQPASPNSILNPQINNQQKKLSIKTVNQGGTDSIHIGSTRNKKKSLSNSPDEPKRKLSQKAGSKNMKARNNMTDLNYFIKSLEKGLSSTTTPSNIIKKVEEQMRSLGVDPKLFKQIEQHEMSKEGVSKPPPPMMMHLALNKIIKEDLTPNNFKKSGDVKLHESESELRARKRVRDSDSKDNGSSSRGGTSYTLLQQPAIMTERSTKHQSLGFKSQGKQSNSTRYDSAGLFQFQKGLSKSHKKGYSTLVSKAIMSPKNEHQQSGGLINGKINLSAHQLQKLKKPNLKLQGSLEFEPKTSAKPPQSTRQLEQGDRKQVTSPPSQQVQKKKRQDHSQNATNKPALFLSPPSYI